MSELLINSLKQAIDENNYDILNDKIGKQIGNCDNISPLSLCLYSAWLIEDDSLIKKNLDALLALSLNEEIIKTILKDQTLLSQLKDLKVKLEYKKIDFFTIAAGAVKEKRLLDKILAPQDIEQIYVKCLRGDYSHPMYGLLETAATRNNVEFIEIFLRRAEQDIQNKIEQTKQLTGSQESLNSLDSDESPDSGFGSSESDNDDLITSLDKPNLSSNIFTKQEVLEGLTTNLVNVLSTAISMEAYETVNYLYDRFNKTNSVEMKKVFITALECGDVRKEYKRQQTGRLNSVKIIKLMKEWYIVKDIYLKFQATKDNINKLAQADSCKDPEDFITKMEAIYLLLNELENSVTSALQTAVDKKDYSLIKNLFGNFNTQSINIKDVFDKVLENEDIQKAIKNSKKIKKILCNDEQSILKMMEKLILKIKNLIEQIINYLSMGKDIKKQSSTADLPTSPSNNINLSSVHDVRCVDAALSR
ncbi:hypothetical protein [Candidatus Mesenet endosymbiont of Phosphuga atrata]|uniref:hypothetical protein n=1 Tax=Candidatus Mesenet endosymbiont of Phosphuga atrata TaxID=3066221 RepID=UPI0030CDF567